MTLIYFSKMPATKGATDAATTPAFIGLIAMEELREMSHEMANGCESADSIDPDLREPFCEP